MVSVTRSQSCHGKCYPLNNDQFAVEMIPRLIHVHHIAVTPWKGHLLDSKMAVLVLQVQTWVKRNFDMTGTFPS